MQPLRAAIPTIVLAAVATVAGLPTAASGHAASAQSASAPPVLHPAPETEPPGISTLREEARRLEAEIERLGARASAILEEYRQALEELHVADAALTSMREDLEALEKRHEETRRDAEARVVAVYQGRSAVHPLSYLDAGDVQQAAVLHHYASLLAARDREVISEIAAVRVDIAEQARAVAAQRDEIAERERILRGKREEVETAMADRTAALARAEGEIAELVEQERLRRQAEEERRLREELSRQRAREEQRRAEEAAQRAAEEARRLAERSERDVAEMAEGGTASPDAVSDPREASESTTDAATPPVHPGAAVAVETALDQIGKPYQWGGNGPESFDCSGLTSLAWNAAGVRLPRSSAMQKAALPSVPFDAIQPGDLLFFGEPVHHVGIYIGNGEMVNAPYTGTTVRIDSIFRRDFNGAGRPG